MLKQKPALQTSDGRSKPWSGSRLVNAFSEKADGDKLDLFAVMAIPGLVPFASQGSLPVRGMTRMGATLYTVIGQTLYSVSSNGTTSALGTIGGSNPVRMVDNGAQIAIVGGAFGRTGYVYAGGTVQTGIENLPEVTDVAYIDGYFVWTVYGGDQFIISALNNGLSYDPLDVATVEGSPDALVGCINDHRDLLFFGTDTVELWYNSGDADFPFARQGNAFVERGTRDRDSIAKIDNGVHFVGDDLIIYRLSGYQPIRISTHAIEFKIAKASWFRAFVYTQEGHKFYVLNTDIGCFAYDMSTNAWHERQSYGLDYYRVGCAATAYGKTIFGSNQAGKLWTPSLDAYDEDGATIPVIIDLPAIEADRERFTLYAFELFCETGIGTLGTPGPQAIMQYSRDGGRTFSNEMQRSLGAQGQYLTRAVWRSNVEARQLNIRLRMPEKARRFVMGYYADIR